MYVALFIIRKTYGYQKTKDNISLSQISAGIGRSKHTVIKAIKNLELVNIVVKQCSPYQTNTLAINKYFDTWRVVNTARLVKCKRGLVNTATPEVVKLARHTKEKRKGITKERAEHAFSVQGAEIVKAFEEINPATKRMYNNTTQRASCDSLISSYGLPKVLEVIAILPATNKIPYIPSVTTPRQLEEKWSSLEAALVKLKAKKINEGAKRPVFL